MNSPTAAQPSLTDPQKFLARLRQSLADSSFQRLVLGRPHDAEPSLEKLLARRVLLRGVDHLSMVWRHRTKDITKNLPLEAAVEEVARLVAESFHHAHLVTRGHDIQLMMSRKGQWGLRVGKVAAADAVAPRLRSANADAARLDDRAPSGAEEPATAHDRAKRHALSLDTPFLAELGVTDAQQRLVPAMARKWRQINKFVEVLGHAIAQSPLAQRDPAQPVRVLDFGAGKGYLTFAVHEHLRASGRLPDVTGVELRGELATLCNQAVARLGLQGLRFDAGDVRSHPASATDIMIALHACDTATDEALARAVGWGAPVILAAPCCHHDLAAQLRARPAPAPYGLLTRDGIVRERLADTLTDGLRAGLLRARGWRVDVVEFVGSEHTPRNTLLRAVRTGRCSASAARETADLIDLWGLRPRLAALLEDAAPRTPDA